MSSRRGRPSIAYKQNQVEGASFDLNDFVLEGHASKHSEKKQQSSINPEQKSPEILTTTELISAVGQIWNLVNPPDVSDSEAKCNHNVNSSEKNAVLDNLVVEGVGGAASLRDDNGRYFSVDIRTCNNTATPSNGQKLELVNVSQKMLISRHCSGNYTSLLFSQFMKGSSILSNEFWNGNFAGVGFSYKLQRIYGWMKEMNPAKSQYYNVIKIEEKKTNKICISESAVSHIGGCISREATHPGNSCSLRSEDCYSESVKSKNILMDDGMKVAMETGNISFSSLCSDYFLGPLHHNNKIISVSDVPNSSLYMDYHIDPLAPCKSTSITFQHNTNDCNMAENTKKQSQNYESEDKSLIGIRSSAYEKPHYALAKQEHAYAGAFSGIFVCLCLHPVDTIKTVTQSCYAEQKSICSIGRSIVSERGVTGLYRGIASNIASSAPISAIYTFTYESVKGSLLPRLSKEYHSFAHCIAGGSASVATSFVFTPSERIKQQMQIGSRYHNCWNALIGIIGKGGLPSLYAGWGAVLCRNVPHSIIKFYTYESLKQLMLSSKNSNAQPNTCHTLVCGGLAGSTAALFTTPFDVVKTRLQIQIPGSMSRYNSVFHALKEIGKNEGLMGLYRGLIPRLIIYVSQGALFFASYEFFKRLFSSEVPQFKPQRILCKETIEDDSNHLQWPS